MYESSVFIYICSCYFDTFYCKDTEYNMVNKFLVYLENSHEKEKEKKNFGRLYSGTPRLNLQYWTEA